MANIPGSVRFTGFIAPTDSTDTYPVTDPTWGLGGLRRVSGTTERDLISTGRRESGMLVYSESDDIYYKLGTGLTNSDWTVFMTGGGSGSFLALSGGTVTGVTSFTSGLSANTFSGGTYFSGGTDLEDVMKSLIPSGDTAFITVDEGAGPGYVVRGQDRTNFGTIGWGTLDMSDGDDDVIPRGLTGQASIGNGYNIVGDGYASLTMGWNNHGNGNYSIINGISNRTSGGGVMMLGVGLDTTGGDLMAVFGQANTLPVGNPYHFQIGNGTVSAGTFSTTTEGLDSCGGSGVTISATAVYDRVVPSDSFRVYKTGDIEAPSLTIPMINAGTGKWMVTKEWVSSEISGFTIGDYVPLTGTSTNISGDIVFDDDVNISFNGGSDTIGYDSTGGDLTIEGSDQLIIDTVNGTDFINGAIFSAGTDLYDIFITSAAGAITGTTNETIRFDLSGNPVSSAILINDASNLTATTSMTVGTRTGTVGVNSFTSGQLNVASGLVSKAGGFESVASGDYSVANGYQTLASGLVSRAEGFSTTASTDYAWAIGYDTEASAWGGLATGYLTKANAGFLSSAFGWGSEANGDQSISTGLFSMALGANSFVYGNASTAHTLSTDGQSVFNNFAGGWQSQAFGWGSTARGLQSIAYSQGAFAEGNGSRAGRVQGGGLPGTGRYAHAQNYFTWAYGDNSHAGGGGIFGGPYVYAVGANSFNHSEVTATYASSGASAANSAILGGIDNVINSGALRSVVLGGQDITGTTADTVYVPNLNIDTAPANDNALTQILARDTDGTVKYVDSSVFAGSGATGGNFLPLSGGTVTGDSEFTQNLSAGTVNLTSTVSPQIIMTPVNAAAPADGSMWFTTSGGTTILNYQVSGSTKSVELT